MAFTEDKTIVEKSDPTDTRDLAIKMSVRQRMAALLKRGAMTPQAVADEIDAKLETVERTVRRYKNIFTVIEGGKVGLVEPNIS